jgi:hypothetical protein
MAQLLNSFENGLSNGTAITTSNSNNGTAGNAFNFVTASLVTVTTSTVLHGTRSALFSAPVAGNSPQVYWNPATPADEIWARMYFRVSDGTPTQSFAIFDVNSSNQTSPALDLRLQSNGKLRIRIPESARYSDSVATIADNTWYRLEINVKHLTSTTVAAQARLYYGANLEGATPDETIGNIASGHPAGDGTFGRVGYGICASTNQADYTMVVDDLGYSDVDWLGSSAPADPPLDTPVVTVTNETGPTTTSGTNGSITVTWPGITGAATYDAGIANGLSQTGGFTTVSSAATSPYTFTGLSAGNYTVAIRAQP